jgi:hypothetical protein
VGWYCGEDTTVGVEERPDRRGMAGRDAHGVARAGGRNLRFRAFGISPLFPLAHRGCDSHFIATGGGAIKRVRLGVSRAGRTKKYEFVVLSFSGVDRRRALNI